MPIRLADLADVPALSRLSAAAFDAKFGRLYPPEVLAQYLADTYAEPAIAALVAAPDIAVWVMDDGALRAYAMLAPATLPHPDVTAGCIELRRFYTDPQHTGAGLGRQLMDAVVIPACNAAAGDGWLGVYSDNDGAQRFYARYGFEQVGEYEFRVGPVRDREFIMRRRRA